MTAAETAAELCAFPGRRGGTDAERRAALWLADELRGRGRVATIETFWCRPNWALAHAWHAILGLAASVVIVSHPRIGGAIALAALVSVAFDAATGRSLGRRLTPEHASQNVVALDVAGDDRHDGLPRLLVTANYDAGSTGLVHRPRARSLAAALRRIAGDGRFTPGWLGWLAIALVWLVVVAIARNGGSSGTAIDIVQIVPSIALLAAAVALLELGLSAPSPAAGDNGAGVAVALATVAALDARADGRGLAVDLVLQGASDCDATGMRDHLRRHRHGRGHPFVVGIAATGAGLPRWWQSDGPLLPLRYDRRLAALAAEACGAEAGRRGRGTTPALAARAAGLPAIAIGCLDRRGLAPRSHLPADTPAALDPGAIDAATDLALALVAAIERELMASAPA
jgi:hypothetical protein